MRRPGAAPPVEEGCRAPLADVEFPRGEMLGLEPKGKGAVPVLVGVEEKEVEAERGEESEEAVSVSSWGVGRARIVLARTSAVKNKERILALLERKTLERKTSKQEIFRSVIQINTNEMRMRGRKTKECDLRLGETGWRS